MFAAIVFDFDGLLVDTESPAFDAWSEIYSRHGQTLLLEEWVKCVGSSNSKFDPVTHLEELTGRSLDRHGLMSEKNALKSQRCDSQPLMTGAEAIFGYCNSNNIKLAIASSSSFSWVSSHVNRLDIGRYFECITTKDDVWEVKPNPELYQLSATRLKVEPDDVLVFEDSLNGVLAAKAAGMTCVAVPNQITRNLDFSAADQTWDELSLEKLRSMSS